MKAHRSRTPIALGFALASLAASAVGAQEAPRGVEGLMHEPPPCMDTEAFPLLEVRAAGAGAALRVRGLVVRFRAEDDTGWYETDFRPASETTFHAALPKPLPGASRVVYYITSERPEFRSEEHAVNVLMGGCPGARAAPADLTDELPIRRLAPDQEEIPRGFSTDGIRTGASRSRTTLGIVAGAAGGAGIAALVLTDEEPPPPVDPGPGPLPVLRACFQPDPIPDLDSGDTMLFDASCTTPDTVTSYQWSFGDGATAQGTSVEHRFRPGGDYTVTLTVSDGPRTDSISRVVRVRATPTACFETLPDPPRITTVQSIDFNAECSAGDRDGGPIAITSYSWDFGDGRPGAEGRFVSRQFQRPDLYGVTLTVTNAHGRQDKTTQFVVVEARTVAGTEVTFTTELALRPGATGQLRLNDAATLSATAPSPQQFRVRARGGENVVDATLPPERGGPGRWRFDFRATPGFVPGSLQVDSGQVLTRDAYSVVFRIPEEPAPPIRFRFRLEE